MRSSARSETLSPVAKARMSCIIAERKMCPDGWDIPGHRLRMRTLRIHSGSIDRPRRKAHGKATVGEGRAGVQQSER